jgi:hypothetical protein
MGVRASLAGLFVLVAVVAPQAHAADTVWAKASIDAHEALLRSVKAGYLTNADAARYSSIVRRAQAVRERVPPARADLLEAVLVQIARRKSPTPERARDLYETLATNTDYLEANPIPADGTDVTDPDGLVYRFFTAKGLYFHPLANGSALNGLVAQHRDAEAQALVAALDARAVAAPGGGALWEYQFDYANVHAPWGSGMAQAVLAQALARAGNLDLARRAFRAIPGSLDRDLPAGPWLELYGGVGVIVLNAQLQGAISIADYAELAGDADAAAYADRLLAAARAMLPQFDTGHWSRYSLGLEANLHYQDYVIGLLKTLGKRTGEPAFTEAAARFQLYETQPSAVTADGDARRLPAARGRRPRHDRRPLLSLEDLEDGARGRRQGRQRRARARRLEHAALDAALARLRHAHRARGRDRARRRLRLRRRRDVRGRARRRAASARRVEVRRQGLLAREGRRERVLPRPARAQSRLGAEGAAADAPRRLGARAEGLLARARRRA